MENKIIVKNISTSQVVLVSQDLTFRRELTPGRSLPITSEVYEELTFDPGFNRMVQAGFIKVSGVDTAVAPTTNDARDSKDIYDMLKNRKVTEFAKFIKTATEAEKDTVMKYAVELGVADGAFPALIKQYYGIDLIDAINKQRQSME